MEMDEKSRKRAGPLAGIRVIDMSRLAPGPYCTMLLADLGAEVIVVGGGRAGMPIPAFARGKQFISLDLKSPAGRAALHALAETADVFVEGFRPGVADRIGAGYDALSAINPRLVYCSITGYGQTGVRSQDAGHDINYLSLTGAMGGMGPADVRPYPPLNLLADFAGGSLVAAMGILAALLETRTSGIGQHIDAAMIDGSLSLMAMHLPLWRTEHWPERGEGLLVGDKPFYRTYACADGKFVAVGALERGFFVALWLKLGLGEAPDHMSVSNWPMIEAAFAKVFRTKSRNEWGAIFLGTDCCVTPVLDPDEIWSEPHVGQRHPVSGAQSVPAIPRLGRTPAAPGAIDISDQTRAVLEGLKLDVATIEAAIQPHPDVAISGLEWPPVMRA